MDDSRLDLWLLRWIARGSRRGRPRGLMRLWPLWERLDRRIWRTIPIPNAPHGIFAIHLFRYRGTPVVLRDGSTIAPGDWLAELHVNNLLLVESVEGPKWPIAHPMKGDLRALAAWISRPDFPVHVAAVHAVTLLGRGAAWLGFSVRDRPASWRSRLDRFFMMGLLALYSTDGDGRFSRGTTVSGYPQDIWMSRAELMKRYGDQG